MPKLKLEKLYFDKTLSVAEIAIVLDCSPNKVIYWMDKYQIKRRSISEAIYIKNHPDGDPFTPKTKFSKTDTYLLGLGNTDPALLRAFMQFMVNIFGVNKKDMRFYLQIFTDIDQKEALSYWIKELDVEAWQFYRPTVTISGSIGTYKRKSQYGVASVYYHNNKLRDILVGMLPR